MTSSETSAPNRGPLTFLRGGSAPELASLVAENKRLVERAESAEAKLAAVRVAWASSARRMEQMQAALNLAYFQDEVLAAIGGREAEPVATVPAEEVFTEDERRWAGIAPDTPISFVSACSRGVCNGKGWFGSRWHKPENYASHFHCNCESPCLACAAGAGFGWRG